jgi:hypothetical protein
MKGFRDGSGVQGSRGSRFKGVQTFRGSRLRRSNLLNLELSEP